MTPEQLARWCGPAALASATGTTRLEAATELLRVGRGATRRGHVCIEAIGRALGLPVQRVRLPPEEQTSGSYWVEDTGYRVAHLRSRGVAGRCPTLARWLRENPDRAAILRASHHFVHVDAGRVVECNGWEPRRGRVTHVVWLD